jgi:hypothetical protein
MKIVRCLAALTVIYAVAASSHAATLTENFDSGGVGGGPFGRGWGAVGDTNLFQWNSSAGHMDVTWDSSKPNSFFYHRLGSSVSKSTDFSFGFDLKLLSAVFHPEKPNTFQLAVGLINLDQATNATYYRGTGYDSPNLAEFSYFPDGGWGASSTPVIISSNHHFAVSYSTYLFELQANTQYRVEMNYTAANQTLAAAVKQDGTNAFTVSFTLIDVTTNFSDFGLDTIAISSYSDAGQDPLWAGSILAQGIIDNLSVTTPSFSNVTFAKLGNITQAQFVSQPGVSYGLERTVDFQSWTNIVTTLAASNQMTLQDTNPPTGYGFYRVKIQP